MRTGLAWVQALPKLRDLYTFRGPHPWQHLNGFYGVRSLEDMKFCPQLPSLVVRALVSLIHRWETYLAKNNRDAHFSQLRTEVGKQKYIQWHCISNDGLMRMRHLLSNPPWNAPRISHSSASARSGIKQVPFKPLSISWHPPGRVPVLRHHNTHRLNL